MDCSPGPKKGGWCREMAISGGLTAFTIRTTIISGNSTVQVMGFPGTD